MQSMPFHHRLSFRLALAVALLTVAAFFGTGWSLIRSERSALTAELSRRVLAEARGLAVAVSNPLLRHDPELELHPLILRTIEEQPDIEDILVVDDDGIVQGHHDLRRIGERWDGRIAINDGETLSLSVPIMHLDRQVGTLVLTASTASIHEAVKESTQRLAMIAGMGTLFAVLLVVLMVTRSLESVALLRIGVEKIGAGHLDTRIDVAGRNELALLAEHINDMAGNLDRAQEELLVKERMTHELAIAQELQCMLLPSSLPTIEGYELAARYESALEVSGDYYDAISLDDGSLLIVAADVSGKGVPGLVLMAMLRVLLHGISKPGRRPEEMLLAAQRMLEGRIRRGMFITCFLGLLDPSRHRLRYVSAGHCPPLLFNERESRWLPSRGKPLGLFGEELFARSMRVHEIQLEPGDAILIYTDGLIEAHDGRNRLLGSDAVVECCRDAVDVESVMRALSARVGAHRGERELSDDLTLLALRRLPAQLPSELEDAIEELLS